MWRPTYLARTTALLLALLCAFLGLWAGIGGTSLGLTGAFLLPAAALWAGSFRHPGPMWHIAAAVMTAPPVLIVAYYAAEALLMTPKC